jgi:hypothetical protein
MASLQSDFSPYSLVVLFGPAELRMLALPHILLSLSFSQHCPSKHTVLIQSSGSTLSDSLKEQLGKAKSSNVAQSIPRFSRP